MMLTTLVVRVELCLSQNAKAMLLETLLRRNILQIHSDGSIGVSLGQLFLFQQKEGCMELGPQYPHPHTLASFC